MTVPDFAALAAPLGLMAPRPDPEEIRIAIPVYQAEPGFSRVVVPGLETLESEVMRLWGATVRGLILSEPGAEDGTRYAALEFCSRRHNWDVVCHDENHGKTRNEYLGLDWANQFGRGRSDGRGIYHVALDGDGEMWPPYVLMMIARLLEGWDVTVGSPPYPRFWQEKEDRGLQDELGWDQAVLCGASSPFTLNSPGFRVMGYSELEAVIAMRDLFLAHTGKPLRPWGSPGTILMLLGLLGANIRTVFQNVEHPAPHRTPEKRKAQRANAEESAADIREFAAAYGLSLPPLPEWAQGGRPDYM